MDIILYSTGCPKCQVLKKKLEAAKINYVLCNDTAKMEKIGLQSVPFLQVGDKLYGFKDAAQYINEVSKC